jgi:hypothetical protein
MRKQGAQNKRKRLFDARRTLISGTARVSQLFSHGKLGALLEKLAASGRRLAGRPESCEGVE